ncbi:MAG: carbon-nitrogen family hydrolase [Planctomycetota bacterium]|nr:carbon-nitrogen family hydrolase [Planctomycetota bacterium]
MRVIAVQLDSVWEDPAASIARAKQLLDSARPEPGSLIVLPEMYATGFSMNAVEIAETPNGPAHRFLKELSLATSCYVMGGIATRNQQRLTNNSLLFSPAGLQLASYEKQQPFTLGGEGAHYQAGNQSVVVDCGEFCLSPLICYDLRFPELARRAVMAGANLLVVIANWPSPREAHWTALLKARAIENQAYVIGVNRTGRDPTLNYTGQSQIIDPQGQVLAALDNEETTLSADLDLAALVEYRTRLPFLQDIRLEFFAPHS